MGLLFTMMPLYFMGNIHCFGMCGPIAMVLGASPFRYYYLLGRMISFTIAGAIAGGLGEVLGASFHEWYFSSFLSFFLGGTLIIFGIFTNYLQFLGQWWGKILSPLESKVYALMHEASVWPLFGMGLSTIALPCGQTMVVYAACALSGSVGVGTLNGFVFGLFTTPALFFAMHARKQLVHLKKWYQPVLSISCIAVGSLAILRGLADFGTINHLKISSMVFY